MVSHTCVYFACDYPSSISVNSGSHTHCRRTALHRRGFSNASAGWSYVCLNSGASFQLFLGGQKFFKFFNATGLLKNLKQHWSNFTLFMVPFLSFSLFFNFFFFLFFSLFSFYFRGPGATAPSPLKWRPCLNCLWHVSHMNSFPCESSCEVIVFCVLGRGRWPRGRADVSEPGGPGFDSSSRQPQVVAHQHWALWITA